jgi:predicted MFS family arabinose efflux permease
VSEPGARPPRQSGGAALRIRDFRLYWLSSVATGLALSMSQVAVGWQVYELHGRPLDLGLVGLAEFLPLPLLALPAGHLADRLPRRTLFAIATLVDLAAIGGLLAVTVVGTGSLWPFLLLAFGTGIASAVGAPPSRALAPALVPPELLAAAFATRSSGVQFALVGGPALGGLLFSIRPELVYGLGCALVLVALACVLAIRVGRISAAAGAPSLDGVLGGVRLVRRTPVLLGAISLDLFAVLFGGAVALLPVFAKDVLEVGPTGLGVLRSAPAAGALLAGIWLSRRPIERYAGRTLLFVVGAFGVAMVVFGLSRSLWLSIVALAVSGGVDMASMVLRATIVPLVTPDALRGRVNAIEMVFISASNELGAFESGVAAALVGAVPAVVIGGAATVAIAVVWFRLFPQLARIDRLDELRPVEAAA